jgi:hypothetical protein
MEVRPRELYTDSIIKNTRDSPSPQSYNTFEKKRIPLGKILKGKNFSFYNDSQYKAATMPGPTTYKPKNEIILKRIINLVNIEKFNESYTSIKGIRGNPGKPIRVSKSRSPTTSGLVTPIAQTGHQTSSIRS